MIKRLSLLLLCFTLIFGAFMPLERGAAAIGTITIVADQVNIRKGPSLSYQLVKQVKRGEKFPIVKEQGDWIEIELSSGKTGWVANWLVTKATTSTSQSYGNHSNSNIAEANTDQLRVRSGPGTGFRIIGYLNKGQAVTILDQNENWLKISGNLGEGWVAREYISTKSSKNESNENQKSTDKGVITDIINVRKDPSTSSAVLGKLAKGTNISVYSKKGNWLEINYSNQKGWVSADYVQIGNTSEPKANGQSGTVTASSLSVRSKASLNASILGTISKGDSFTILEESNNWVKIEYLPGKFGWAAGWYFSIDKAKSSQTSKESKDNKVTILHNGSNIGKSPDVESDVLIRANEGETFAIKSVTNDWYEITLPNGTTGYIAGWIVTTNNSGLQIEKQGAEGYLKSKTIVIDPGHGGIDDGASGAGGTLEKELTLRTATLLYDKLKAAGANVFLTRTNDSYIPLPSRVRAASIHGADAFISLHYDSSLDRSVRGMTGYYYHPNHKALAEYVYNSTNSQTKLKDRGVRSGDFHVIRENQQKSVLMELGYLSNATEEMTLKSGQFQESAATGLFNGLARFFKEN